MSRLWPPMMLSLRVALVATLLVALIGIPLSYFMGRRSFRGKSIIDALLIVPLVLPPTVVGYLILVVMGAHGVVGSILKKLFDYSILFNWHGAVVASTVVALPLLYLPARAAFASIDSEMEDLSKLMGASALQTFWHVSLPLARRGIASGLLLAFARALGEFGATIMVMGSLQMQQTLPISIYDDWISNDLKHSAPAVMALGLVSFAVVLLYNRTLRSGK
jgi:molybdate transport system permease protein